MVGKNTRTQFSNLEKKQRYKITSKDKTNKKKTNMLRSICKFDIRKLPGTHWWRIRLTKAYIVVCDRQMILMTQIIYLQFGCVVPTCHKGSHFRFLHYLFCFHSFVLDDYTRIGFYNHSMCCLLRSYLLQHLGLHRQEKL